MLRRIEPLWDAARPSILEHVRAHVPADDRPGLADGGDTLPDDADLGEALRWAPGALDGAGSHHFGVKTEPDRTDELFDALRKASSDRRGLQARRQIYAIAREGNAIGVVDPLLDRLRSAGPPADRLQDTARWLVTEARHREPVKLGIALLGLGHAGEDRDVLKILGRHEEFTLFVAVALGNTSNDPDRELYELARSVDGWGRIHLVERLRHTDDPEIREWIFRQGFRNAVMDEYLAHIAATTGDLVGHLERDPDEETIDTACDILSALLIGGPAQNIDDYGDGARAVLLLLRHLHGHASRLKHFLIADEIGGFLASDDDWDERAERGWSEEVRGEAQRLVDEIRAMPRWEERALQGLDSSDPVQFYEAERIARALGHDTFLAHWRRLSDDPIGGNWWVVMRDVDDERIDEVLEFAERSLPLAEIASGPGTAFGMGPEWAPHRALDFILQELGRFPGRGWPLVRTALRSPVIRNRGLAITVLFRWGPSHWPGDAPEVVATALAEEPHEQVRERLHRLARGEPDVDARPGS